MTVLSDDVPFDASPLVGPGGSADLDAVHALDDEGQVTIESNSIESQRSLPELSIKVKIDSVVLDGIPGTILYRNAHFHA